MKSFSLSIPVPCHEKWKTMAPTAKGAFCPACCREVVDFTSWSDDEVIAYFVKGGTGCGRLREDQLRTFEVRKDKGTSRWWVAIAFAFGLIISNNASAQSERRQMTEQVAGDEPQQTRVDELNKWSAERSAIDLAKPIVDYVGDPVGFQGLLGCMVAAPVQIAKKPWYWSIYDMLRW